MMGCTYGGDRHEAFIKMGNYYVGQSIQELRSKSGKSRGVRQLPNGNLEEEWGHNRPNCSRFYEFSATTGVIVAFRFTGSKTDCVRTS